LISARIIPDADVLETLSRELDEARKGKSAERKVFLNFLEACWRRLPDYVDKEDADLTAWPDGINSSTFFMEYARNICQALYAVPPDTEFRSLSDLLLRENSELDVSIVNTMCGSIMLISPDGKSLVSLLILLKFLHSNGNYFRFFLFLL